MNFDASSPRNLPELHWRFGLLWALGSMHASAGCAVAARRLRAMSRVDWEPC